MRGSCILYYFLDFSDISYPFIGSLIFQFYSYNLPFYCSLMYLQFVENLLNRIHCRYWFSIWTQFFHMVPNSSVFFDSHLLLNFSCLEISIASILVFLFVIYLVFGGRQSKGLPVFLRKNLVPIAHINLWINLSCSCFVQNFHTLNGNLEELYHPLFGTFVVSASLRLLGLSSRNFRPHLNYFGQNLIVKYWEASSSDTYTGFCCIC